MFVIVYSPSSNETYYARHLSDSEPMDLDAFADQVADAFGVAIDHSGGYVPSCSGDLRVEFRPDLANSVVIWSGQSYFFKQDA